MARSIPIALALLLMTPLAANAQDARAVASRLGTRIETSTVRARGTAVEWGRAVAVVDAPFETTMRIVQDYGKYHEFLPHFTKSRVLSRRGANALVYLEASVIHGTTTLHGQVRIFARRPQGPTHVVEGRLIDGNMRHFLARWELTPLDGGRRTLVGFQILVDPDLPLPASVFTDENIRAARKTLQALRRRADQRRQLARNP